MIELDVDIGNSRAKWRLRDGDKVLASGALAHESLLGMEIPWQQLGRVNLCSVARPEWAERLRNKVESDSSARFFEARTGKTFGRLRNGYQEFARLGVDRWLAMIGGLGRTMEDFAVISFGTAITLDFVTKSGEHLGGYILPGIRLQRQALLTGTHAVNSEDRVPATMGPGNSTSDCVLNGVYASLYYGVQGILRARAPSRIYMTGGDADLFVEAVPEGILVPDLILDGLRALADVEC